MGQIEEFLRVLKQDPERTIMKSAMIRAVNNTNETVTIELDASGDLIAGVAVIMTAYSPVVNDPVLVLKVGARPYVLGPLSSYKGGFGGDITRYYQRSEMLLMHAPQERMSWDGATFGWTGRLIALGAGNGSQGGSQGFLSFRQPAAGTNCNGSGGSGDRAWTPAGIAIGDHEALYGRHNVGGASEDLTYSIVSYTSPFVVPQSWVLLAHRSEAGGPLRVMTGRTIDSWRTPTLANGWVHYNGNAVGSTDLFGPWQYRKTNDGMVHTRGLVAGTSRTSGAMLTMPAGFRPARNYIFDGRSNASANIEWRVHESGLVEVYSADAWISLVGSWYAEG